MPPPSDGVAVTPADLRAHAARVDEIAGQITTAKQAGDAVRLDAGAYGKLCAMLPVLLGGLQGLVIDGIDAASQSLRDSGERLRTAAQSYQTTDNNVAARHDRIRNAL
jgi:hypothetical protein